MPAVAFGGTPVTHSGELETSSSSEDLVANALTCSQEELQEARRRAEEANAHLRAVQERLDGRVDDRDDNGDQSEQAAIGSSPPASVIIQMENIPAPPLITLNRLDEWNRLRAYEERMRAAGRAINRRSFLSQSAYMGHYLKVQLAARSGFDFPGDVSADAD